MLPEPGSRKFEVMLDILDIRILRAANDHDDMLIPELEVEENNGIMQATLYGEYISNRIAAYIITTYCISYEIPIREYAKGYNTTQVETDNIIEDRM